MPFSSSHLVLLLIVTTTSLAFNPQLHQLHVITRHGARTALPKHRDTLLDAAGATLTPLGQKQLYDLGTWLRDHYNGEESQSNPTLTDYRSTLEFYDPSYHRLESSGLDRTLTSANALSLGLFPLNAQAGQHGAEAFTSLLPEMPSIPVYSRSDGNDVYMRAYKNCPTFHERLARLYASDPWKTLERNHAALLLRLGATFPDQIKRDNAIQLRDVWNVYDPIHVVRTECRPDNTTYACSSIEGWEFLNTALDDAEFEELEQLMMSAERLKYGVGTAGNLLGSTLLWRMLNRDEGNFFLYSAHAATVLGFLSTMKETTPEEQFVEYGSAVFVEFHQEATTKQYYVRMAYKKSSSTKERHFSLEHIGCGTIETDENDPNDIGADHAKKFCPLSKFLLWASANTLLSKEDWCTACNNTFSDVCMRKLLKNNGIVDGDDDDDNAASTDDAVVASDLLKNENNSGAVVGSFFGGLFAGFIIMGMVWVMCGRRNGSIGSGGGVLSQNNGSGISTVGTGEIEKPAELQPEPLSAEDLAMVEIS